MALKEFHVGKLIQERLKYEEHSVSWLARKLGCDRSNIYHIFAREHLDSELLLKVSIVLNYNFFESYKEPFEIMKSAYMKNGKDLEKVLAKKG